MLLALILSALAADPCLDRECLYCLLGEPIASPSVKAAAEKYALTTYGDMLHGGRGVVLGYGGDGRVSEVQHSPDSCGANCIGGVPFGLSAQSEKAAIEAALPGGAWTKRGDESTWSAGVGPLRVEVTVDSRGLAEYIRARAAGPLDPVRAEWCRDGAWPGVRRADGTVGAGDALARGGAPAVEPTEAAAAAWLRRFQEAPEGSAQRAFAWEVVEAADDLRGAHRALIKSADGLAEGSQAPDNAAARAPYLNGHVELQTASVRLAEAAERLRRAVAEAQRGGWTDGVSRVSARLVEVEALRGEVAAAYDVLPRADEVAASSNDVPALLGPLVLAVLRFDARLAEIAVAL